MILEMDKLDWIINVGLHSTIILLALGLTILREMIRRTSK